MIQCIETITSDHRQVNTARWHWRWETSCPLHCVWMERHDGPNNVRVNIRSLLFMHRYLWFALWLSNSASSWWRKLQRSKQISEVCIVGVSMDRSGWWQMNSIDGGQWTTVTVTQLGILYEQPEMNDNLGSSLSSIESNWREILWNGSSGKMGENWKER